MGMPIKAVRHPAAPAYASVAREEGAVTLKRRAMEEPMSPPAPTIGASGPTENPKVEVIRERRRRGRRLERLGGRSRLSSVLLLSLEGGRDSSSAGTDERAVTKSATP
jgi:hypothetical protein